MMPPNAPRGKDVPQRPQRDFGPYGVRSQIM
jgi:hypothetical protein